MGRQKQDFEHGTPGRYRQGCRCPACATARYQYEQRRLAGDDPSIRQNRPQQPHTYQAVHKRLIAKRGKAREQRCITCHGPALDWSLRHGAPNAVLGDDGSGALRWYSPVLEEYIPLCRSCHRAYDGEGTPAPPSVPHSDGGVH